jgi:hypothetical protein
MTRRRLHAEKRRYWSSEDDAQLRELYPDVKTEKIAERLRRSLASTYNRARKLGLERSAAYLASADACRLRRDNSPGVAFRFPKGHVPANKGLRRPGWSAGRMKETQFKKGVRSGQAALNWRPIGSQRLVDGYRYTKISDIRNVPWTRNWKPTHVLLWESHNGPVPAGHALKFVNGDRTDIRLDNLKLITRRTLMAHNSVHNLPKPVAEAVQLLGVLNRKINRRSRDEKQDRRSA